MEMEGVSNGGDVVPRELYLAALASDLDSKERQMMQEGNFFTSSVGDYLSAESHNVSLGGDFSIQVLQKALEVWDLQVIAFDSPVAEHAQIDPDLGNAFISCMDSLKDSGWSIFLVIGNFPKEFPIASSEAPNGYGQWLSPEDAERITKSCNTTESPQTIDSTQQAYQETLLKKEDQNLKAALAASKMESSQSRGKGGNQ
ncbi:hypothetical protein Peur_007761 [Populus x canadensis]